MENNFTKRMAEQQEQRRKEQERQESIYQMVTAMYQDVAELKKKSNNMPTAREIADRIYIPSSSSPSSYDIAHAVWKQKREDDKKQSASATWRDKLENYAIVAALIYGLVLVPSYYLYSSHQAAQEIERIQERAMVQCVPDEEGAEWYNENFPRGIRFGDVYDEEGNRIAGKYIYDIPGHITPEQWGMVDENGNDVSVRKQLHDIVVYSGKLPRG